MLAAAIGMISTQPAAAAGGPVVYSAIPAAIPPNVPSLGFEATQTTEFGDEVGLTNTSTPLATARVLMSSWGCQTGSWTDGTCVTSPGSTFSEPITFNVYAVNNSGPVPAPGALLATKTQTFTIPFRPSADPVDCTGADAGKWFSGGTCYNGYATPITFDFTTGSPVMLPSQVIWTVAYNTSDYGTPPYGDATACHATSGGCGYDSLNVGLTPSNTVGTDTDPDGAFWNTSTAANYCDGGAGGVGILRYDTGVGVGPNNCNIGHDWTGFTPAGEIQLASPPPAPSAPSAPRQVSATPRNKGATVYWQAPASNGGSAITGYVVTPFKGGVAQQATTFNSKASTGVITRLTNATTYVFKVAATNSVGTGPSGSTGNITAGAPGRPGVPKVTSPAADTLRVGFKPPAANGAKVTGYTAICDSPNGAEVVKSGSKSPIVITGATAGKKYYCIVLAKNARGTGPRSLVSSPLVTV
jgi:hypothetical protein